MSALVDPNPGVYKEIKPQLSDVFTPSLHVSLSSVQVTLYKQLNSTHPRDIRLLLILGHYFLLTDGLSLNNGFT